MLCQPVTTRKAGRETRGVDGRFCQLVLLEQEGQHIRPFAQPVLELLFFFRTHFLAVVHGREPLCPRQVLRFSAVAAVRGLFGADANCTCSGARGCLRPWRWRLVVGAANAAGGGHVRAPGYGDRFVCDVDEVRGATVCSTNGGRDEEPVEALLHCRLEVHRRRRPCFGVGAME